MITPMSVLDIFIVNSICDVGNTFAIYIRSGDSQLRCEICTKRIRSARRNRHLRNSPRRNCRQNCHRPIHRSDRRATSY